MTDSPFGPAFTQVTVDRMRVGLQQRVGAYVAESLRMSMERGTTVLADEWAARIETELLAERLPPTKLHDAASFTVPRFATWFDHFVATYRNRWWGRPLRRHALRYVDEPHTHRTEVVVLDRWTYPRATMVLPGRDFGHVVLKSQASWNQRDVTPW